MVIIIGYHPGETRIDGEGNKKYILELRTLCMKVAVIPYLVRSWSTF